MFWREAGSNKARCYIWEGREILYSSLASLYLLSHVFPPLPQHSQEGTLREQRTDGGSGRDLCGMHDVNTFHCLPLRSTVSSTLFPASVVGVASLGRLEVEVEGTVHKVWKNILQVLTVIFLGNRSLTSVVSFVFKYISLY